MQGSSKIYTTIAWDPMPSVYILGGPWILGPPGAGSAAGEYFKRTYTGINSHTYVAFTFKLWYFDDWKGVDDEAALIWYIDSTQMTGPKINYYNDFWSYEGGLNTESMGSQAEDCGFVHIKAGTAHTGSTMTFKITGRLTDEQANERFGFRELSFIFSSISDPGLTTCHLSDELALHDGFVMYYDRCQCDMNQIESSTCSSCPARWKYCWSSSVCLQCDDGLYWSGTDCCHQYCKTCTGTTSDVCPTCHSDYYNYGNNTCKTTCPSPFKVQTVGDQQMCNKPCDSGKFYFAANDTCLASCPSPLASSTDMVNGIKYCYNPCSSETLFLYKNGSCFGTCPVPLVSRSEPNVLYCFNPCSNPANQYLYINRSCLTTCPLPLLSRTEPDVKYCYDPCSATEQFLYTDSTCMNNCQSPLAFRNEPDVQYCFNPCLNPSTDHLFTNVSCLPSCPAPLASRQDPGVKYCYNPCPIPAHQYLYLNGTCLPTCHSPLSIRLEPGVQFCENPCPSPSTEYLYANGTCSEDCYTPLVMKTESDVMYCMNPCGTDTVYLHMNGSCLQDCVSPLIERSEPGTKYCFTPCSGTQYLFTNETCVDDCLPPLASKTESGIAYCYNPCASDTLFLYPNGSCHETCPYPLANRSEPGVKFCYNPCPSPSIDYLYENGTCSEDCFPPLVTKTESYVMYCMNPCGTDTVFLYPNGSCLEDCPYPLVNRSEPGTLYCWNPCLDPSTDFLYSNQSCFDSCPAPLAQKLESGINYCFNPCPDPVNDFLYTNGSCYENCSYPLANRSEPDVQYCYNPCSAGEYLYANGTCSGQCNNPLVVKIEPDVMYCVNPCSTDTLYLYANLSCFEDCPSPLVAKNEPGVNYCFNPCDDPAVEYLYTNGSCYENCSYPLANRSEPDVQYCYNPCLPDEYLYSNQTCSTECPPPLVSRSEPDVDYCFNPCPDPIADFLYTNGSCLSTCPSPLYMRTESGVKYCYNPCPTEKKYLYPNGSCLANCPSPLLDRSEPGVFYCYLPCAEPNIYWYANGSCMPNCTSPYQQIAWSGVTQCLAPCKDPSYFYYEYEKACFSTCGSPYTKEKVEEIKVCYSNLGLDRDTIDKIKDAAETIAEQGAITSGGMKAASALNSANPSSALLAGLSSMLQYIRYMKVNYPPKVETLFMVSADAPISISFDFDIPPGIDAKMDDYPLPYNFDKYDINSNFVRNMWDMMGSFLASVIAIFGLMVVTKLVKRCPTIKAIFQKVLAIAKWNIPAMTLYSSSGDILFYASLHINVLHLDDITSIICFLVLLLMVGLTILLWFLTLQIVRDFKKVKNFHEPISLEESGFKDKWQDYELLYAESEEESALTFSYMAFFIARGFVFNLTIGCLYEFPLVQVSIINASNFLMFGYLIVCRPLKDLLNLVQVLVNEAMIIVLSVTILILAIMDELNIKGTDTRESLGEAIYFIIKAFNTMGLVFMGIQLLMTLIFAYKAFKYFREKGIKNPLKMLKILAFEEFESEAGLLNANNPLARIMKAGKRQKIRKPPRKDKSVEERQNHTLDLTSTDIHNTSSANLITNHVQRRNNAFKKTSQSILTSNNRGQSQIQTTEIESSEVQSRLEFPFNATPVSSPLRGLHDEATFRFDQSEVMSHQVPTTEEEIRNSLNKSMRKLTLRARSSSPLRRLNIGNTLEGRSLELGASENQDDMMEITLFPESSFAGGVHETSTIDLFADSYNLTKVNEKKTIYDSLRKLKERKNRLKNKEEPEGTNKAWLNKIRKFKEYLRNKKE